MRHEEYNGTIKAIMDLKRYNHNDSDLVVDTDLHFVIDSVTRKITNQSQKNTLVKGDHNSERITFECPRYIDGHDMLECNNISIIYLSGSGVKGKYLVEDIHVKESDKSTACFTWLISHNVTKDIGNINFVITFKCIQEDSQITYIWQTLIDSSLKVVDTIWLDGENIFEESIDILDQWEKRIKEAVDAKLDKTGHNPNKYLGTDSTGAVVEKEVPSGGDYSIIGSLSNLMTKDKTSIVAAINELYKMINGTVALNRVIKLRNGKFKLISSITNAGYNSTAEAAREFDDNSWKMISIPHDWSIYNSFNSKSQAGYQGGFLDGGDAWYRFKLNTKEFFGQKLYVYFDGIYMESDIYINGTKLKSNKWYNPFYVDITDYVKYDNEDVLAVFVRNRQPSSRWYSGSGIIRNAYLVSANDLEIGIHDIHVTTPTLEQDVKTNIANTKIDIKIESKIAKTVTLLNEIYFEDSLIKSESRDVVLTSGSNTIVENIVIDNPILWDEYKGNLYTLKTYLKSGSTVYHFQETKYGYRYFRFDKDTGFYLNSKNIKLKGVCMHHDLGCIGAEINRSAVERQVDLLIKIGVNAIRLTHNPGSSEYLNVCAEKGVLLIEEMFDCWTKQKMNFDFHRFYNDYADEVIESTVNRGKNNPAIILWSMGNEIIQRNAYTSEEASTFVRNMMQVAKSIDSERPITMGEANVTFEETISCYEELDVIGVNYGNHSEYETIRNQFPNKCIYGSETTSALSTRGIYQRNDNARHLSSFDDNKVDWGEYAAIDLKKHMHDLSYLAGMFVWTGFDYIGEPTPYSTFPSKSSNFGIYDICGFPKDIAYMYQSRWTDKPMVHILPHWDWESGNKKVWLYSNCYKVELFFNGTSLGEKLQTDIGNKYQFEYFVNYKKGTLVANGYDETGTVIAQDVVYTSLGTAVTTKLSSDKTSVNVDSDDLVFITCDLVDSNGVIVPTSNNSITFSIEGGTIIATDNGDANCVEDCRTNIKSAFNGKVLCVAKHDGINGSMTIKASGTGLLEESAITVIKSKETVLTQESKKPFVNAANPPIYNYGEDPDLSNGVIYELSEPAILNGIDQSIDTGIQLFDTNKDFSVFVDFTSSADQQTEPDWDDRTPTPVFHSIHEVNPWDGVDVTIHTGKFSDNDSGYDTERGKHKTENGKLGFFVNTLSLGIPYNSTDRHKVAIVKMAADGKITVYDEVGKVGEITGSLITNTHSAKVTLGAVLKPTGEKSRWWTGTIHKCSIWSRALTQTEITKLFEI